MKAYFVYLATRHCERVGLHKFSNQTAYEKFQLYYVIILNCYNKIPSVNTAQKDFSQFCDYLP